MKIREKGEKNTLQGMKIRYGKINSTSYKKELLAFIFNDLSGTDIILGVCSVYVNNFTGEIYRITVCIPTKVCV